jgi:nicotinamidase-related amidase
MVQLLHGAAAAGGAMDGQSFRSREWWTSVPEDERRIYEAAGYSGSSRIEGKAALVVIDAVLSFTGTRPLPVLQAIAEEYVTSCGEHAWQSLPYIERLLGAFRSARLPVVYTRLDQSGQKAMRETTKRPTDDRVSRGNDFLDRIRPREEEWICEKARASAFYGTILDSYLRLQKVETIVFCGGSTSGCVRASVVDAFSAGFRPVVAEEATFDRAQAPHRANLFDIHAKYGQVMLTDDIVSQLVPEPERTPITAA